jgi:GNAT superfamily N-acetyltransferase
MNVVVRAARDDDADAIEQLLVAARNEVAHKKGGPALLEGRASRPGDRWLALLGGVPVGVAVVRVVGAAAVLEVLFTEPSARGVGVGHALMEAVTTTARERGCARVESIALPGDRHTKNFFEAHGLVARALIVSAEL